MMAMLRIPWLLCLSILSRRYEPKYSLSPLSAGESWTGSRPLQSFGWGQYLFRLAEYPEEEEPSNRGDDGYAQRYQLRKSLANRKLRPGELSVVPLLS